MNKIYALKYSCLTGGLIAVSELSNKVTRKTSRRLMTVSLVLSMTLSALPGKASTVSAEIPYQTFRDFAENKGVFTPGVTGIEIKDNNGNAVGTLDVPMIDFSSVSRRGSLTLLSQGYGVSAKHGGLGDVNNASFGYDKNNYTVVKNNKHSGLDFSLHRFSKLITEAAPADINISGQLSDSSQYTAFYRAGAGTQYIKERSGKQTHIPGTFLTGGTVGTPWYSGNNLISSSPGDTYNKSQGPLASYGQMGDSGSPLFAYDSLSEKWSLAGVTLHNNGVNGQKNNWLLLPEDYIKNIITADFDPIISFSKNSKEHMSWTYDAAKGVGRIQQDDQQFVMHGNLNGNLNAGKNLYFTGANGIIDLKDNVNQGAGYLQFADDYTVTTSNASSWFGGGIIVNSGTTVKWGINGVSGDDLHKVGDGTLIINGTGKNEGGLKIGAGTVILEQKAKNNDSTAFSSINISGGNSRVKLSGDNQIIPDNVSWGFRGGYLDINGKNTEFSRLQAVDYGAAIINSSTEKSLLTLNLSPLKKDEIAVSVKALDMNAIFHGGYGTTGDLYKTTFYGPTQYYLLKKPKFGSVLMGSLKNTSEWQFAGTDLNQAVDMAKNNKLASSAQASYLYHGKLLGNMDIVIPELTGNDILTLDGSVSISGNMSKQDGALIFQGHPVIHAGQTVSASQSNWENREFSLNNLNLNNADFSLSRNAFMNGNIRAVNQSTVIIGGDTVFTDKNDGTGNDVISVEGKSAAAGTSSYTGHITLEQKSALDIRDNFRGGVTSEDSHINVSSSSVLFSDTSSFINSSLNIHKGGALTAQGGLFTSGSIDIGDASLLLTGTPVNSDDAAFLPTINMADGGFKLMSDSSVLKARDQASVIGDIISDKQATISFGTESGKEGILSEKASRGLAIGLLSGFNTAYRGAIHAPSASATVNNTWWQLTGDSSLRSLKNTGSMTYFTGSAANKVFHTLTVDELTTNGTAYAMRTDLKNADKLVVNQKLSGKDNILLVDFLNKPTGEKLDIELVSAPGNSSKDVFKGSEQAVGFSNVTPVITAIDAGDKTTWNLTGYRMAENPAATQSASGLASVGYKSFLSEVN
ncbi:TPA: autotransporter outer membrane beta-barrel domain-containing protein, partial [Escherichia coli]|nr:autotransporter outer membrane beta-barrel domain-containing protein [Escherichia coli]EFM6148596.1 autotransporter outer membrane beta-barrel domain-containing protein [Escherichia coli]EGY0376136.1 autotransporter outer membrane beta-barrel domain-containing protein [Escherichia coli]EIW7369377.1 autotransporter outer membrane beta-barrel domain-containing protein [Escherichia coli]EJF8320740.1 autotransporter outer membrane beta-barrel domain-containing protein [Escherichia coli]